MNDEGDKARVASNADEALSEFNKINPSVVILDVWLNNSKMDGVEILSEFKSINKDIPVIMMSGHGTVDMAVSATKKGAYDFIAKPFRTEALLSTIVRALDTVKLKTQVDVLQNKLGVGEGEIIGFYSYVRNLNTQILKNSNSQISLIFGDTGTGKEVVVQNLYKQKSTDKDLFVFDYENKICQLQLILYIRLIEIFPEFLKINLLFFFAFYNLSIWINSLAVLKNQKKPTKILNFY